MDTVKIIKKSLLFVVFSYFLFSNTIADISYSINKFKTALSNKIKENYNKHEETIKEISVISVLGIGFTLLYYTVKRCGHYPSENKIDDLGAAIFGALATLLVVFVDYNESKNRDRRIINYIKEAEMESHYE